MKNYLFITLALFVVTAYGSNDCPTNIPTKLQVTITNNLPAPASLTLVSNYPYQNDYTGIPQLPQQHLYTSNANNATTFGFDFCLGSNKAKSTMSYLPQVTYTGTLFGQPISCTFSYTTSLNGNACVGKIKPGSYAGCVLDSASLSSDGTTCVMQFSVNYK